MLTNITKIINNLLGKIKTRPFSSREKQIIYFVLIIMFLAIIVNLIFFPLSSLLERLNKEIDQKSYLYQRYSGLIKKGEDINTLYDKYRSLLGQQQSLEEGTATLFEDIKKTAANCNVTVEKVKPLASDKKSNYKQTSLEIELTGNFSSIFDFISQLEYSSLVINIKSLQLASYPGAQGMLQGNIIFSKIFF